MKKIVFALILLLSTNLILSQSSKVIYSNSLTHFYLTCYTSDTSRVFTISETSTPLKNVWRFSDRMETQVLETFTYEEITSFLSDVLNFAEQANLNDKKDFFKNIEVAYIKVAGIKVINLRNTRSGASFNVNKKTIVKALETLSKLP